MSLSLAAPGLAQTFARILGALGRAVAARMSNKKPYLPAYRLPTRNRPIFPLLMLLHIRLRRMIARFEALARRMEAETQAPAPLRPNRQRPPSIRKDSLPRGKAWLIPLLPYEAAAYGSQLRYFLSHPDMKDFMAPAPQLAKTLRPLCRALGIPDPEEIPVRPPPVAEKAPPPIVETPAPGPGWRCVLGIWKPPARREA